VRSRSHLVEADPAGDHDEPSPLVIDSVIIGGNEASERFLYGILGRSQVSKYAKGQVNEISVVRFPYV
jgi:hypothetical protein